MMNRMRMRMQRAGRKLVAVCLAALVACAPLSVCAVTAANETAETIETVFIGTASEFLDFAKQCKTDIWSQGKHFVLTADINLKDTTFESIPTFSGVFDGGGHTISGLALESNRAHVGLFRYVQESGIVRNLHAVGVVTPEGDARDVGGIAGENRGLIDTCSFSGTVKGDTNVGGIVGSVAETGTVRACSFSGSVTGDSFTGGIVGYNSGTVEGAVNRGRVNTTAGDTEETIQDLNVNLDSIRSTENVDTATDTGGISGLSKGRVVGCINYGSVGYRSVGYNTGGICGRQSGWMSGCENYGEVRGRKDVGGIVGQAEPYILLEYAEDVLEQINRVFDRVSDIFDSSNLREDAALNAALDAVRDSTADISDAAEKLSEDARRYADALTASANEAADRLHTAIDEMTDVLDRFSAGMDKFSDAADAFADCGDSMTAIIDAAKAAKEPLEEAGSDIDDAMLELEKTAKDFSDAFDKLHTGVSSMDEGMADLKAALQKLSDALGDHSDVVEPLDALDAAADSVADAFGTLGDAAEELADALEMLAEQGDIADGLDDLVASLRALAEKLQNIQTAFGDVSDALATLAEDFDAEAFEDSLAKFSSGFGALSKSIADLRLAAEDLQDAADELVDVPDYAEDAIRSMQDGLDLLSDGADAFKDGLDGLSDITTELSEKEKIELPSASEMFGDDPDTFFDKTDSLSDAIETLRDSVGDKKDDFYDELDSLQVEMRSLRDILKSAYDDSVRADEDGFVEDISDDGSEDEANGRIANCKNAGTVDGDINAGGIVGSLAIEYDFDPEDDIKNSGDRTLKYTYKTKCTVVRCKNEGEVMAKKHNAGGIVGLMDFGSVYLCENRGDIATTDGDYTGGIAGKTDGTVRTSLALCNLTGGDYVGGIVGGGKTVSDCLALVHTDGSGRYAGSIAGDADTADLVRNCFVSETLGGIDDVSYTGVAEAVDIDTFTAAAKQLLDAEVSFALTFVCEGETVAVVPFTYGETIPEEQIPAVPSKDGYYGKWDAYDYNLPLYSAKLEANYFRDVKMVVSDLTRADDKPILFVSGSFDDAATVALYETDEVPSALHGRKILAGYKAEISAAEADSYTVRYLPQTDKHGELYVVYGDKCEKVKCRDFGSYLEFSVPAADFALYEVQTDIFPFVLGGVCGAVLLLGICLLAARRRGKKKKAEKQ